MTRVGAPSDSLFGATDGDPGQGRPTFANSRGLARNDGPDTMHEAADSVAGCTGAMRRAVYAAIVAAGDRGMTDDEGEQVTGMRHQSYSARRRELALSNIIHAVGRRATRSGRSAIVWAVADGSAVVAEQRTTPPVMAAERSER